MNKLPRWIKSIGRKGRSFLFPYRNTSNHLKFLAKRTTKELGFHPMVTDMLEVYVSKISHETGLDTSTEEK
jgi:hypothetical protein